MFKRKKVKKAEYDQRLLEDIQQLKHELSSLRKIMKHSIDSSTTGMYDLAVTESKYFYLLREARYRNLSAKSKL